MNGLHSFQQLSCVFVLPKCSVDEYQVLDCIMVLLVIGLDVVEDVLGLAMFA